jgi:hypothetical protein
VFLITIFSFPSHICRRSGGKQPKLPALQPRATFGLVLSQISAGTRQHVDITSPGKCFPTTLTLGSRNQRRSLEMSQRCSQIFLFLTLSLQTFASFPSARLVLPPCISPDPSTPLWFVADWSTNLTIPDDSIVTFRLNNTLTGYSASCFREGLYPQGYCARAGSEGGAEEEDDTATLFEYNERVEELGVYQEWACADPHER